MLLRALIIAAAATLLLCAIGRGIEKIETERENEARRRRLVQDKFI